MKKLITVVLMCFPIVYLAAQSKPSTEIGIHAATLSAIPLYFQSLEGAGSYHHQGSYGFGLSLQLQKKKAGFLTGLDFSHYRFSSSWIDGNGQEQHSAHDIIVEILTIPLNINLDLTHGFHLGGGPFAAIELRQNKNSFDRQTGLGMNVFIQKRIRINPSLSLGISPEIKIHALLPTAMDGYHRRLLEARLKLSLHLKTEKIASAPKP